MAHQTFLDKLSTEILSCYGNSLSDITIILPNKRARIFLIEALKKQLTTTTFAPEIISIEDFIQDVAGIRTIDTIELLFEFYTVYESITPKDKKQSFEPFSNWAKTLLQDFNEIDRYLLPPEHVFSYLKDIEDIKHWSLDLENQTDMIKNYLAFWKLLPDYYNKLYDYLLTKGTGYQGLIYREAVANIKEFSENFKKEQLIFAGFNALNAAEEKLIQYLMLQGQAKVYWDIDEVFLNDPYHDAGMFIRRFKTEWKQTPNQSFEWISDVFKQKKNIHIIGTPKTVGQAKIAGKIIEDLQLQEYNNLNKTALVLGEENMLIPILYSLPESVGSLNITMGYSSRNNPAQILIQKLFKLHTNALNRNKRSYTLYYREVLDVLNHPLVEPHLKAKNLVATINKNNITFFSHQKLYDIQGNSTSLFDLIFERWDTGIGNVLQRLLDILTTIKSFLSNDDEEEKIVKAFLYSVFTVINKLITYYEAHPQMDNLETLQSVYNNIIDLAEVSFEGEPLSGLQIMGVLESRVLDFENVIITSVNEGKLPAGKTQQSFIPYDVKRELGLPTFKEKDAIYSYHFYHLLMRAKNIYLLYNTESEGLDAGERSRFITQLEIEKQPAHTVHQYVYNAKLPRKAYEAMQIPKSTRVLERLQEIATIKGFSPSALTGYIRNPIRFYYQRVLRINETDEVEESIALNTLGTIIHGALEALYLPYIDIPIKSEHIKDMTAKADEEVMRQFTTVYREGEIKKGRNLLAFEVAKRNIHNLLKQEEQQLEKGDEVVILALEKTYSRWLEDDKLPYSVKISGNIDRIERRNGRIRIIDYKTGKVDKFNVVLKEWNGLTADSKNEKIIQLLAYAFMYEPEAMGMKIEAGIISFKNMRSGFMPFSCKEDNSASTYDPIIIDNATLNNFKTELVVLINEILDVEISFQELM